MKQLAHRGICFAPGCKEPVKGYVRKERRRLELYGLLTEGRNIRFCQYHMEDILPGAWHKESLSYLRGV